MNLSKEQRIYFTVLQKAIAIALYYAANHVPLSVINVCVYDSYVG